jgi:hypothetical protein
MDNSNEFKELMKELKPNLAKKLLAKEKDLDEMRIERDLYKVSFKLFNKNFTR